MKFSEFVKIDEIDSINEAPMGIMHRRRLAARRASAADSNEGKLGGDNRSKDIESIDRLISAFSYRLGLKSSDEYNDIIKYTNNPTWYNEKFKAEVQKLLDKSKAKLKELETKIKNFEKADKDYYQIPYWNQSLEKYKIRLKDLDDDMDIGKVSERSLKNLEKSFDSYIADTQKLLKDLGTLKPKFKELSASQLVSLERYFMKNSSDIGGTRDCIKRVINNIKEEIAKK